MISVKILGCILVFSACALGGYAFKNKISMRVSELENMMSCLVANAAGQAEPDSRKAQCPYGGFRRLRECGAGCVFRAGVLSGF